MVRKFDTKKKILGEMKSKLIIFKNYLARNPLTSVVNMIDKFSTKIVTQTVLTINLTMNPRGICCELT